MKKNLAFVLLLIFVALPIFTQENSNLEAAKKMATVAVKENGNFRNGISIGGFGTVSPPSIQGGASEFGFGLIQAGNFYMRNHIEINATYQGIDAGFYGIRERLILGGHFDISADFAVRPYGIFEFGFSVFRISDPTISKQNTFEAPFILEPRGGFGVEVVFYKSGAIFIEFLSGERILTNGKRLSDEYSTLVKTHVSINVGARLYIN